jgi:hypothetical protein
MMQAAHVTSKSIVLLYSTPHVEVSGSSSYPSCSLPLASLSSSGVGWVWTTTALDVGRQSRANETEKQLPAYRTKSAQPLY